MPEIRLDERAQRLLDYWFGADAPRSAGGANAAPAELNRRWFGGGADVDADVTARFADMLPLAAAGELDGWAGSARGRLALILLLDQVARQVHRGTRRAFAQDDQALALTVGGIDRGMDLELPPLERAFFYMPLQHAESLDAQRRSVERFDALAASPSLDEGCRAMLATFAEFARIHRDIVARFGRFPHRNRVLGRETTAEEAAFLAEGAPRFGQ